MIDHGTNLLLVTSSKGLLQFNQWIRTLIVNNFKGQSLFPFFYKFLKICLCSKENLK